MRFQPKAIGAIVFGLFVIGCQTQSNPSLRYFSDIHIGESATPGNVRITLVFARPDSDLNFPIGLAHYTEHIVAISSLFNGDALSNDFRHGNAWTSSTAIGYWLDGPEQDFATVMQKLVKVLDPVWMTEKYAVEEADVVLREYDLGVKKNVDAKAYLHSTPFLYEGNAIAMRSIGTPDVIATFNLDLAKQYFYATHLQSSAVLLVQGDVSEREVVAAIEAAGIEQASVTSDQVLDRAPFSMAESEHKTFSYDDRSAEPRLRLRKIVRLDKPVDYDLLDFQTGLLGSIMQSNLPGGLAGRLRYDNFIASSFSFSVQPIDEQHIEMQFFATPDKGVPFGQLQSAFEQAVLNVEQGIPPETFDRVSKRSDQPWPDWDDDDQSRTWLAGYASHRVAQLRTPLSAQAIKKTSEKVTLDGLNTLLKALQKPGRQAVVLIGKNQGDKK